MTLKKSLTNTPLGYVPVWVVLLFTNLWDPWVWPIVSHEEVVLGRDRALSVEHRTEGLHRVIGSDHTSLQEQSGLLHSVEQRHKPL